MKKVTTASLYLEPQQFLWYQWLCKCKKNTIISWSIFSEELIAYHDDVKRNSFFTQLINLRKNGLVIEHIQQFQKLGLKVEGITDDELLDLFIRTLKDKIQHEVHLFETTSYEKVFMVARKVESKNLVMATRRTTLNTSKESNVPSTNTSQPTRLTPQQLEERREKGLCLNCDSRYSKGHKCGEKKLFYIENEGEEGEAQELIDGGKNLSQQRETLPILQVPVILTNVWYRRVDGIMDPLPSNVWLVLDCFKSQEHKMAQLSRLIYPTKLF